MVVTICVYEGWHYEFVLSGQIPVAESSTSEVIKFRLATNAGSRSIRLELFATVSTAQISTATPFSLVKYIDCSKPIKAGINTVETIIKSITFAIKKLLEVATALTVVINNLYCCHSRLVAYNVI